MNPDLPDPVPNAVVRPPPGSTPTAFGSARVGQIGLGLGLLALLALYSQLLLAPIYSNSAGSDFAAPFYPAARLLLAGGNPYDNSTYLYMQPPALLLMFAPLTALPLATARALWLLLELGMLAGGVALTLRVLGFRLTGPRWALVLCVYCSPNVIWGVMIGQSVILIFLLQALGLALLRAGQPFLAGLALGAIVLKPHLLAVELPVLLSAPRRAWAGALISSSALLLGPELLGIHLLGPFIARLLAATGQERYNKLNPADMFVNLGGGPPWLRALGWGLLALLGGYYLWLLWRVWRARQTPAGPWQLTPLIQQGMAAAFLFLPYTLAYDMILVAGSYLARFQVGGYRLDRALTWSLGLLWLLPILTLFLHAKGVPTTLNPLLIIGLLLLLGSPFARPARPGAADV